MIAFRFLQLALASACLSALVEGQDNVPPFSGFEIELCDLPCANNGSCLSFDIDNDGVMDPQCFCNTTFQGDLCETPRTCSLACENGGTCTLAEAWWLSLREDDSEVLEIIGEILYMCDVDGRDCKTLTHDHCQCPSGTKGQLCETTCDKTCLNDSECTFWGYEQRCRCKMNFYGDQCENECTKGCQNRGFCLPAANGSGGDDELCLCPAGFEGELCETEIPCPMTCQNEGVCKFYDERWFAEDEEADPDFLQQVTESCTARDIPISECLGGFLGDQEQQAYCQCPPETRGRNCENTCDLECQNGSCEFFGREGNFCRCDDAFAGDLCQFQCSKNCVNGGTCNANATAEWCQCSPYYEGESCEIERSCDLTCENGGSCVFLEWYREYSEKYFEECLVQNSLGCPGIEDVMQCRCTNDFVGSDCGTPCPCQNGGTCSSYYHGRKLQNGTANWNDQNYYDPETEEDDGGYFCRCPFGFYGQDCEFKYDSEDCVLDCQNGGYCQADFGWLDDDGVDWNHTHDLDHGSAEDVRHNNNDNNYYQNNQNGVDGRQSNSNGDNNNYLNAPTAAPVRPLPFEYCVCPDGFRGISCEIEIDACDNQCKNGGVCTIESVSAQGVGNRALQGFPTTEPTPAPQFPVTSVTGYCSCPEGYSGEFCQRKDCGSGYCSHGGTCIELPSGQTTSAGDDYVCECSTSSLEGAVGIGRNCDTLVYNDCSWVNSKKNPNEPWSCGGWGRCGYMNEDSSSPVCYCATRESMGPRCEFNRTDTKDVAWSECNLQCSNDGICLKGASKPVADIFIPFVEATRKSGLFDYQTPDFEYCYCPDGYFGVQCDMQYDICGNKDHICFHGSKCKNNGGEWGCDCAGTESAGLYCQYKATDDCGDSDPETFCTNDSTCTNGACACQEGWEGSKCETEIKLAAPAGGGDNSWSSASMTGILVSIMSVAMLSLAFVVG